MLHYNDALKKILEYIPVMDTEMRQVSESAGYVTSADIFSGLDLPPADVSIPDGYAVISEDTMGAGRDHPVRLKVTGTARAGHLPAFRVTHGCAVRIMTGSLIPEGADSVVMFENTDEPPDIKPENRKPAGTVTIYRETLPGENVRHTGSSICRGDLIIPADTFITPAQIAALLSAGTTEISVIRKPVIAFIPTGDEIIKINKTLSSGMVYNSNVSSLSALISHYGGIPVSPGIARDNIPSLLSMFRKSRKADLIITAGGISGGDYDLVKAAIERTGTVILPEINMMNGKAAFSILQNVRPGSRSIPVFSLAGPPSGCLISFFILVRQTMLKMRGITDNIQPVVQAEAANGVICDTSSGMIKWAFLDMTNGNSTVKLNIAGNPLDFTSIANANAIAVIPGNTEIKPGDIINVIPFYR